MLVLRKINRIFVSHHAAMRVVQRLKLFMTTEEQAKPKSFIVSQFKQGRQVEIYEDNVLIITLRSLGEAAEFIKEMKSISTSTINLKKNIQQRLKTVFD